MECTPLSNTHRTMSQESTEETHMPFYRPSIFYVDYLERRYSSFQYLLEVLPRLEKHCVHFDISRIIRYYCESQMSHQNKYAHLRAENPREYDAELIAHTRFIDGLYQLHRFRTFVTTFLKYAHDHMPIHVKYFTTDASQGLTLAEVKQEEALYQEALMTKFQRVQDMLSIVEDVPATVWNRYMDSLFVTNKYAGYLNGYAFHRLLKCIYEQLDLYLNSTSKTKHVRIEESDIFIPIEYDRVLQQEKYLKRWIVKIQQRM